MDFRRQFSIRFDDCNCEVGIGIKPLDSWRFNFEEFIEGINIKDIGIGGRQIRYRASNGNDVEQVEGFDFLTSDIVHPFNLMFFEVVFRDS